MLFKRGHMNTAFEVNTEQSQRRPIREKEGIMKRLSICAIIVMATLALSSTAFAGTITGKDALKIALNEVGFTKSQVKCIEIESENKDWNVEFRKKATGTEYNYEISKADGTVLEKGVEYRHKHNASKAKVGKKAVLKKVARFSGIKYSVVKKAKCTYKYKKNEGTYTVKFRHKGRAYEYELLAPTGKVIEWEWELIGR